MTVARAVLKRLVFMDIAENLAALGTCDRKQVGCVIVKEGRCVSWGFNGAPPGLPHCADNDHGYNFEHDATREGYRLRSELRAEREGCRNATHAEANALAAAAKQGISTDEGQLFTTVSPCDTCSRLIIAAGIVNVFYREEYRDASGIELLRAAGIFCTQL